MDLILGNSAHTISRRSNSNVPNRPTDPAHSHTHHRKKSTKSKKSEPSSSTSALANASSRGALRRNLDSFGAPKAKPQQVESAGSGPALLRSRPNIAYAGIPKIPEPPLHARHSSLPANIIEDRRRDKGKQREIDDDAFSATTDSADQLREEVEALKKLIHEQKKTMKKQKKQLEEREREASTAKLNKQEQDAQIQTLKTKVRKNDELVSTIEAAMQCQICMDLMIKPFALSPCGHVLCLDCLQSWFRSAPAPDENGLDPEDPDYVLRRDKTCPCCRAVVTRKPVPIFIVKNVAQALARAKDATPPLASAAEDSTNEDPWRGIFLSDTESDGYLRDDMDEESLYEYGYDDDGAFIGGMLGIGIYAETDAESVVASEDDLGGFDEEDEDDDPDAEYVDPVWEPPCMPFVDAQDYTGVDVSEEDIRLLQRGCTLSMIRHYSMQYEHHRGLTAFVSTTDTRRPNEYCLMLGWNVHLNDDDLDGASYITDVLDQVDAIYDGMAPEIAWEVWSDEDGVVHAQAKGPGHPTTYTDTDTDEWLD